MATQEQTDARVVVPGMFAPGQTIELEYRGGPFRLGPGAVLASGTVDDDGTLTVDGLEPGPLWAVDEDGHAIAVTAKVPAPGPTALADEDVAERLASTRPVQRDKTMVQGARSTLELKSDTARAVGRQGQPFALPGTGRELGENVDEDPDHPRIEDHEDEQLRSCTATGEAYSVDPERPDSAAENQPDVEDGTPQLSDTELGRSTVASEPEVTLSTDAQDNVVRVAVDVTGVDDPPTDIRRVGIDWGDGTQATDESWRAEYEAEHIYAREGTYELVSTVTAWDGGQGTGGASVDVTLPEPEADDEGTAEAEGDEQALDEDDQPETDDDEVPNGTVQDVLDWVGDDSDRAQEALEAERAGQNRSTLITQLEAIA